MASAQPRDPQTGRFVPHRSSGNGHDPGGLRSLAGVASILTSRADLAARAGLTFENARDLYKVLGYKRQLTFSDFHARYRRGGLAKRIVNMPAQATWRKPPRVIETEDDSAATDFERGFDALAARLRLWHFLERGDRLAGIGRFGVLLLGLPGPLEEEAEPVREPGELRFLAAYHEGSVDVESFEDDPESDRFGLPKSYRIDLSGDLGGRRSRSTREDVHWSRVLHLAEDLEEDEVYGRPRLENVWNLLDDLEKVTGSAGETFWLNARQGLQLDVDREMRLDPEDKKDLEDQIEEYQHELRRVLRTRGVTLNPLGSEVSDPRGAVEVILRQIAGARGIPLRMLQGSERGELASTQDRLNWNERVMERNQAFAEPLILRPLLGRLVALRVLPEPGQIVVEWPDLLALTEREKSENAQRYARAAQGFAQARMTGMSPIDEVEARERFLDLPADRPSAAEPDPGGEGGGEDGEEGAEGAEGSES